MIGLALWFVGKISYNLNKIKNLLSMNSSMNNVYTNDSLKKIAKERISKTIQDDDFYYLYKYLSFDQEMLILNIFNKTQLKYTKPLNFNDPYDCTFITTIDLSNFTKKNAELCFELKIPSKNWFKDKTKFESLIKNKYKADFNNSYRNRIAVTCFTDNPLNILMWSHYSNNHSGFVIEFKIPKDNSTLINQQDFKVPQPVIYVDKYPEIKLSWNQEDINLDNIDNQADLLAKMVLTKAQCWSYEAEFRAIVFNTPEDETIILDSFDPRFISSVITGTKISQSNLDILKSTLDKYNISHETKVKIYHAKMMDNKYKLQVSQHPILGKK